MTGATLKKYSKWYSTTCPVLFLYISTSPTFTAHFLLACFFLKQSTSAFNVFEFWHVARLLHCPPQNNTFNRTVVDSCIIIL